MKDATPNEIAPNPPQIKGTGTFSWWLRPVSNSRKNRPRPLFAPGKGPRPLFRGGRGFTLVECLATMLLLAIILPVVDQGIATTTLSAGTTRHRTEASGLAQSKLSELIVGGSTVWASGSMAGDFGADWPDYKWSATTTPWTGDTQQVGMQQLEVTITWTARNQPQSITVSSLVYARPQPTS